MRYSPFTCTIQGDISRADAVGLHFLCEGRQVVEFGVGASTGIIARCAKSLISYDTSQSWIGRTKARIANLPEKVCEPQFVLFGETPAIPSCDILWIDGEPARRQAFLDANFHAASQAIVLHGALRHKHSIGHTLLPAVLSAHWDMIRSIDIGYMDSHLLVIHKRVKPLGYYNYHETEHFNHRLNPLSGDA